ncbi:MAG: hypothetical protein Q7P63_09625 [Verrucomicrobiota bacterium JB022]|nr:hypothetical protein [Verrucomicrobiota bacterium JB022]
MKRPLNKLTRELRREKCPPQVLDRVFAEVDRAPRQSGAWWWLAPALTLGALALAFALWPEPTAPQAPAIATVPDTTSTQAQAAEVEASLVLVGHLLRENGLKGGQQAIDGALPQLQSSLQTLQSILQTETTEQTPNNET